MKLFDRLRELQFLIEEIMLLRSWSAYNVYYRKWILSFIQLLKEVQYEKVSHSNCNDNCFYFIKLCDNYGTSQLLC